MQIIRKEFNQISDIPRWIEQNNRAPSAHAGSKINTPSIEWDLRVGFDGAMEMAKQGGYWEYGAQQMTKCHTYLANLKKEGKVPVEDYDVTGHTLDVGAYLAGQPDCFLNECDEDADRHPIVSIGVHVGRAGNVSADSVIRRGAAILSVIDDLEDQGFRVELWALWTQHPRANAMPDFRVCVKSAEEQWSPHSVAFAICHPAMNRRLLWRVAEAHKALAPLTREGYSRGVDRWHESVRDFDVYFGWQAKQIDTMEDALSMVQSTVRQALEDDDD